MDLRAKPFFLSEGELTWVEDTLHSMELREKVGQLFCVMGNGFSDEELVRFTPSP